MREDVAAILPNALEVRIDPEFAAPARAERPDVTSAMRTPQQLFADYCAGENVHDERVAKLFAVLHEEVTAAGPAD